MKEAAGEANMTVITIVLIAIVLGIGTVIVTNLMKNASSKANEAQNGTTYTAENCAAAGGVWSNNKCEF